MLSSTLQDEAGNEKQLLIGFLLMSTVKTLLAAAQIITNITFVGVGR